MNKKNKLTLSINKEVLHRARKQAKIDGKNINTIIADYLKSYANGVQVSINRNN